MRTAISILCVCVSIAGCGGGTGGADGGSPEHDAAVVDGGGHPEPDAGPNEAGPTPHDAAPVDAGPPDVDTGVEGFDAGPTWPTCEAQPSGVTAATIPDVWTEDPTALTEHWVSGVYVTAISGGGCVAGTACQFFVQQSESYASLAAATHQSLRVFVSAAAASHFTTLAVGDRIDLDAYAQRDTTSGHDELMFVVNLAYPGCARTTGTGNLQPVSAQLSDFTVDAYQHTLGPVLVRVSTVSGRPAGSTETFGLWPTGSITMDPITTITSLSPFFLSGAAFSGLTQGVVTNFASVVGVFGIFSPGAGMPEYEEIYVRTSADYVPM